MCVAGQCGWVFVGYGLLGVLGLQLGLGHRGEWVCEEKGWVGLSGWGWWGGV